MKKHIVLSSLLFLSIAMIMFGVFTMIHNHFLRAQEDAMIRDIVEIIISDDPEEEIDKTDWVREAMSQNADTIGWLEVPGTRINTPVVQRNNNDFYLYHNFQKRRDPAGWVFADFRNDFPELNTNTILYGHTLRASRVVFSDLSRMLNRNFFNNEENFYIDFTTIEEEHRFRIFSVYTIRPTDDYLVTTFADAEEYRAFQEKVRGRSVHRLGTRISAHLPMLTLSTCSPGQTRLVVHAILVED